MTETHPPRPAAGDPVLRIEHLAITFPFVRPAVEDVSLTLGRGEILALVGESGSGKSMSARAVLGLLPPGAQPSGRIEFDGQNVLELGERGLDDLRGRRIAMVFQEPQTALNPVRTIGWQLKEALRAHGMTPRREVRARSLELLREVEIPEPEKRLDYYPHQLSGGQKQRVVLALALANQPDIILADEPTTALDVTVQQEILRLLRRIRDDTGTAVVLITHNMGVVAELADRVVVLKQGNVVETGPTEEIFTAPRHPYTRELLGSVLRLPARTLEAAPESTAADDATGPVGVLELDTVSVRYGGRRATAHLAVQDVSLSLGAGEILGLVGESGSGKTTLGRLAAGLVPISGGRVLIGGTDVATVRGAERRSLLRGLAIVHQDPESSLDPRLSIGDSIREPLDIQGVGTPQERDTKVARLLEKVHLPSSYSSRRPKELSGGQRQRVALARALALDPTILVADEPTSALDVSVQARVLELFAELHEELGFAALFISHDLAVVHEIADRVAVLQRGQVVEQGPVAQVFGHPRSDYTRRLIEAVPAPEVRRAG